MFIIRPAKCHGPGRQRLLDAAAALIVERGAAGLTLDAVAAAAHVSKGGLLYYFESKLALLEALVDDLTDRLASEVGRHAAGPVDGTSAARAYLSAVASMGELPRGRQLCKALTIICAAQPELVERARAQWSRSCRRAVQEPESLEELHLRLVADGLWLADLFGCYDITRERRAALLEKLGIA